ncbi:sugar ABC transporter ATP-binding protein [Roseibacterium sp. SDUM158017]|uniref:sugar ABC transporter ATP-binding protein n=1 Tax=Roseicyclus salinarum TaxID=3036773 RepID=UPI0024159534|nr:sugar ABC transporter ATP-binding protein [Roseibacterium sp. SDUM158017]MDG4648681.1 sugar ABC transporter ATP-binding protein [Roseibacterium sp. SDUM158017]
MSGISKSFPGVRALNKVDFAVEYGRVHAIVGENGAGKSTLMKIVSGVHPPSSGKIEIDGREVALRRPADAQRHGLRMVHQEISLAPDLTVAENVFLGRTPRRGPFVDTARMVRATAERLAEIGAAIDPSARVGDLTIGQQQLVEITRAYSADPRIIVLDEPTSSLSEIEATALLGILRRLRDRGIAIVYISHRLQEVLDIANDVSILRDGEMVETRPAEAFDPQSMIRLMVGRDVSNVFPKIPARVGDPVLRVDGLGDGARFSDIGFEVRAGEILGITGLVGAGRTELARAIFGLAPITSGRIEIDGREVRIGSPSAAIAAGIAYVPEDRKGEGLVPAMSVRDTISLAVLRSISRLGFIRRSEDRNLASRYVGTLGVVPTDPERQVRLLSGGNQQKAVIGRWLAARPRVLILDEPTRGVDVAAKAEIHRIIGELVADGMAVVMISSELPEVMGVSDRVLIMREGVAMATLPREALAEELIMAHATGQHAA